MDQNDETDNPDLKIYFSENMCKENEYMCNSGKNCIPLDYICDGVTDCEDNDDEAQCNRKRDQIEFRFLVGLFNSRFMIFCLIVTRYNLRRLYGENI